LLVHTFFGLNCIGFCFHTTAPERVDLVVIAPAQCNACDQYGRPFQHRALSRSRIPRFDDRRVVGGHEMSRMCGITKRRSAVAAHPQIAQVAMASVYRVLEAAR